MNQKKSILILCWDNATRSQFAEGFSKDYRSQYDVISAGIEPKPVHPLAIKVMKENGIDISSHSSKSVNQFVEQSFDYIITLCDKTKEHCPSFTSNAQRIHWQIQDPAEVQGDELKSLAAFRQTRDEIHELIHLFSSLRDLDAQTVITESA